MSPASVGASGAEAEGGEVFGLRGAEGGLGEPSFELRDPGLGGAEACGGGGGDLHEGLA